MISWELMQDEGLLLILLLLSPVFKEELHIGGLYLLTLLPQVKRILLVRVLIYYHHHLLHHFLLSFPLVTQYIQLV